MIQLLKDDYIPDFILKEYSFEDFNKNNPTANSF